MAKKTVSVAWLLEKTNHLLAYEGNNVGREHRLGAASVLESVLMETGNYAGFNSLQPYNPDDPNYDDSRRVYHRSWRLQ